jgi:hypothetical protein
VAEIMRRLVAETEATLSRARTFAETRRAWRASEPGPRPDDGDAVD